MFRQRCDGLQTVRIAAFVTHAHTLSPLLLLLLLLLLTGNIWMIWGGRQLSTHQSRAVNQTSASAPLCRPPPFMTPSGRA